MTRDEAKNMVGQHVTVFSHRMQGQTGIINSYLYKSHHFWVKMDKPYITDTGKESIWHKCNAGNCKALNTSEQNPTT